MQDIFTLKIDDFMKVGSAAMRHLEDRVREAVRNTSDYQLKNLKLIHQRATERYGVLMNVTRAYQCDVFEGDLQHLETIINEREKEESK